MSNVLCYTSCTFSYLDRARTLAKTLKRFHPDWRFVVAMIDVEPEGFRFNEEDEPFDRVLRPLDLEIDDLLPWMFGHDVVELCTAVKGPLLQKFTEEGWEKIIYLDPDTAVLNPLTAITRLLDDFSVVITPHQAHPEEDARAIVDNEICSLNFGVYNLGFLALRNDRNGQAVARWWRDRLMQYCHDDRENGLFVDQKWFDLVPAMFDGVHILRDPGYNVASWNLTHRRLTISNQGPIVNDIYPLRFFHFTKMGALADVMTRRYAQSNDEVYEIWAWYRRLIQQNHVEGLPAKWWYYGKYSNGEKIEKKHRVFYRNNASLKDTFPNPFKSKGDSFLSYYNRLAS